MHPPCGNYIFTIPDFKMTGNLMAISITIYALQNYKPSWKGTNNHFLRYSDVKPREERRNNIIDLANQENIQKRLSGWKIVHLRAQIEDLVSQW